MAVLYFTLTLGPKPGQVSIFEPSSNDLTKLDPGGWRRSRRRRTDVCNVTKSWTEKIEKKSRQRVT